MINSTGTISTKNGAKNGDDYKFYFKDGVLDYITLEKQSSIIVEFPIAKEKAVWSFLYRLFAYKNKSQLKKEYYNIVILQFVS